MTGSIWYGSDVVDVVNLYNITTARISECPNPCSGYGLSILELVFEDASGHITRVRIWCQNDESKTRIKHALESMPKAEEK